MKKWEKILNDQAAEELYTANMKYNYYMNEMEKPATARCLFNDALNCYNHTLWMIRHYLGIEPGFEYIENKALKMFSNEKLYRIPADKSFQYREIARPSTLSKITDCNI